MCDGVVSLAALQAQLDGLAAAVEGALAASKETEHDDDEAQQRTALLQQALGLVRSSAQAHGRASARRTARPAGAAGGAKTTETTLVETMLPAAQPHEMMLPVVTGSLDPEEREARELEALRAQFAAGAAEEEEELDWSAPDDGGGGSDDEADAPSLDGAADDDAAARLLRALPASSSAAAAKVTNWESAEGYVPQGTPGFNEFAREQMRRAGVPSNPCVRPPAELVPAAWAAPSSDPEKQPRLQPYQETVAFLCRPQSLPNPRMLVVHRTGCGKTATMIQVADKYFSSLTLTLTNPNPNPTLTLTLTLTTGRRQLLPRSAA